MRRSQQSGHNTWTAGAVVSVFQMDRRLRERVSAGVIESSQQVRLVGINCVKFPRIHKRG